MVGEVLVVVVSIVLTALFSRTFGPRKVLRDIKEQTEVYNLLPPENQYERAVLRVLIEQDVRTYRIKKTYRFPRVVMVLAGASLALFTATALTLAFPETFGRYSEQAQQLATWVRVALYCTTVVLFVALVGYEFLTRGREDAAEKSASAYLAPRTRAPGTQGSQEEPPEDDPSSSEQSPGWW